MKRKNILCLCMIVLLISGLVGCGKESRDNNAGNTPVQEPEETEHSDSQSGSGDTKEAESAAGMQGSSEQESAEEGSESIVEGSNVLIAYFSIPEDVETMDAISGASIVVKDNEKMGNTEYVAKIVQQTIGGESLKIFLHDRQGDPISLDPSRWQSGPRGRALLALGRLLGALQCLHIFLRHLRGGRRESRAALR